MGRIVYWCRSVTGRLVKESWQHALGKRIAIPCREGKRVVRRFADFWIEFRLQSAP